MPPLKPEYTAPSEAALAAGHETTRAHAGPILVAGVGLAVTILLIMVIVWAVVQLTPYGADRIENIFPPELIEEPIPPEPRVQAFPELDWLEYKEAQLAELTSYGWIDSERGIVRIPIDRAAELILEEGLPVREEAVPEAAEPAAGDQ